MVFVRDKLRELLSSDGCVRAACIFDPLSARIAELQGWPVGKVSGTAAKAANLCLPDEFDVAVPLDMVEVCERILRVASARVPLVVDADDGGPGPLNVRRTVRDLETVGVAGIEIDDLATPSSVREGIARHSALIPTVPIEVQVRKLNAAVEARRDSDNRDPRRTCALATEPIGDDASDRIAAYTKTGVDGLMFPQLAGGVDDLERVRGLTDLPLVVLARPRDSEDGDGVYAEKGVRIRYVGTSPYSVAVRAIFDALEQLRFGGTDGIPQDRLATPELLRSIFEEENWIEAEDRFGH